MTTERKGLTAEELDAVWDMLVHSWSMEDRAFFEREGPKAYAGPAGATPLLMAIHHTWKRDRKPSEQALDAKISEAKQLMASAYHAILTLHGDAEDCEDCAAMDDAGVNLPCRVHGPEFADCWRVIEAIEDALGPCSRCGHTRTEHNDCDNRRCLKCACENFHLQLPVVAETTVKDSLTVQQPEDDETLRCESCGAEIPEDEQPVITADDVYLHQNCAREAFGSK